MACTESICPTGACCSVTGCQILTDEGCTAVGGNFTCEIIIAGDFDDNGNVDVADWPGFVDCMAGPSTPPDPQSPDCIQACLDAFDFNGDGVIDLKDAASLEHVFSLP
ncbi:MAG: EF-hand domain-containing protein [Planctomycetes bacterium]|nr:EF-hand domain-containing protein [Planctomycetota bacterium]